ncbi:MAG: SUMF1/EgtB/PvdO family nonheme iron enzyme [Desulfobacteraceae bacterium]|nr:SUMF1/EgtB/PvdO family nonheme iron enzyme [Desulfobacteraceae bacterium]MBC2720863.1 SUMF1/EgtB/PvdO family nonheme iron enzyme [Desulfobacteraceae bacterium]
MARNNENNFALLSDEPILESERTDHLEFKHTAGVLARAALYTDSPITIGVFGNWGSGKTSLMRLMWKIVDCEGQGDNAAVAVWFNAWQYEREEHLIVPLIATIARDIKKKQEQWEEKLSLNDEVGDAARKALNIMKVGGKKVHDALRSVLYGVSMKGKLGVPLLGELEISASMKNMIERYEAVTQDTLMARSLYFDAFDQLRELSHDKDIKKPQIVVFIDDLDRCFPEQAVRFLESVKLVLHQPRFSFVLGIYPQIVEEFIRNKYAAQYPMAAATAASRDDDELRSRMNNYLDYFNDYLGKIVQVRHYVPERRPDQMQGYIRRLLDEAGVTSEFLVKGISEKDLLELIAEVGKRSPREIVRKINGLIVKWRIAKSEKSDAEPYDLLAGLINETILDRVTKGRHEYEQFLHLLEMTTGEDDSTTYGRNLAEALEKTQNATYHGERISMLKKDMGAENIHTMTSLIEILEKDEHLCNVLNSRPGYKWLSDKKYREEMRETYEEKPYSEEARKNIRKTKKESLLPQEPDTHVPEDFEHIIQGLRMAPIPAGEFNMGSEDGDDNEKPIHLVKLDRFEISSTPVTQAQYKAVMGANPSYFKEKGHPVENVSWNDAMVFCEQLTKLAKGKRRFTLPTEAQWEYACRAGMTTPFNTGENLTTEQANYNGNYPYRNNPKGKYLKKTTRVGSYPPNEWGLYDMHGNVWEWCMDWYGEKNYDECNKKGSVENPAGPETGSTRVLRGGSWSRSGQRCRSAYRYNCNPGSRYDFIGFRLVFVP